MRRIGIVLLALLLLLGGGLYLAGSGVFGAHEEPGTPVEAARPAAAVKAAAAATRPLGNADATQILFGDLHVHTTFSFDAFMLSLPLRGEGAHPPADACDFARFCSALDFWSINDHAEAITPRHWQETVESIRQCNARASDPADPDTVAFLGWEWTQVGDGPADHYGHKNVVLKHADHRVPARPIAASSTVARARAALPGPIRRGLLGVLAPRQRIQDFARFLAERDDLEVCPADRDAAALPPDCLETADTPADLYRKLDAWGYPSIVIPHGTTWGFYTPPGSSWEKQLRGAMHDPDRQTLIEVYSGHGDSEPYRAWRAIAYDEQGRAACPEPGAGYLPTCWRAGEIVRGRCLAAGESETECERRAAETRQMAADAGQQAFLTVPGAEPEEWLDAGQCTDCDEPAFNYRPGGAVQYAMALSDFEGTGDPGDDPRRFRFGFIASSDNHYARPGTGYKEVHRLGFTESTGGSRQTAARRLIGRPVDAPEPYGRAWDPEARALNGFQLFEFERQTSYFLTGGLVAAHARGRDREAIWDAFGRREVYGTTGPRILLWFDLLNPPEGGGATLPMGAATSMARAPSFRVRAVGSFEQLPGCPDYAVAGLGADALARLCKGECWNPSDRRRRITRIEVVRIRPQRVAGEPVESLIEDPWLRFSCPQEGEGCSFTFRDDEHPQARRDALYYVRAYEEEKPAINAGGVRCTRDAEGRCTEVQLCPGPADEDDDCLAPHAPRAWSSPIFVDWAEPASDTRGP